MTQSVRRPKNMLLYNVLFVLVGTAILTFLLKAPPESTKHLPHDDIHEQFFPMAKKEAEAFCENCHRPDREAPLPANHPPKYRCLFCHKRT